MQLHNKYSQQSLCILGFPCNQFGSQEPGGPEEIKEFVAKFGVQFRMFEKIKVNGSDTHPVFSFLKSKQGGLAGDFIKWNFTKFLVDRNGEVVKRYGPKENPLSFEDDIKSCLDMEPGNPSPLAQIAPATGVNLPLVAVGSLIVGGLFCLSSYL